jgi:hypothetical protein
MITPLNPVQNAISQAGAFFMVASMALGLSKSSDPNYRLTVRTATNDALRARLSA